MTALKTIGALTLGVGFIASAAFGQSETQSAKLYRWVDADGKVHYSDSLPAEAVDQARKELSKGSATVTAELDRALTIEERRLAESQAEELARIEAELEKLRQRDRTLVGSYPNEAELNRSFKERLDLLDESIKAAQVGIESQRMVLVSVLANAADRELNGERVPTPLLQSLRDSHGQGQALRRLLFSRQAERAATEQELQETIARYRELKKAEAAENGAGQKTG